MPAAPPVSGPSVVLPVLTDVAKEVTSLEELIVREEWLPTAHVAKHGPRARDRKEASIPLWRGWHAVQATMRAGIDQSDLTHLRKALLELAGASVKFIADIDVHLSQNAPLPVDTDDPLAGVIRPVVGKVDSDEDEEEETEG